MTYESVLNDEDLAKLRVKFDSLCKLNAALPLNQESIFFYLDEDMFAGILPDGRVLAIGWIPSHDPNGSFHVDVNESWEADWNNAISEGQCRTIDELRQIVRRLIDAHSVHKS